MLEHPRSHAGSHGPPAGPPRPVAGGFRLGDWQVRPDEGVLRRATEERHLAPRPMAILELLGERSGSVVSKQEIFDAVWQGAAVEDGALPRCISEIRSVLGDSARQPRYIRTIPKRGYRLIAPVEKQPAQESTQEIAPEIAQETAQETARAAQQAPAAGSHRARRRAAWWLAATLAAAALAAAALSLATWMQRQREPSTPGASGQPPTIAVLGIESVTADAETEWLSTALAEMLTTELAVSRLLRTIPEATVASMKAQLSTRSVREGRTLGRLRAQLGADLGVVGSYWVTPGGEGDEEGGGDVGAGGPPATLRLDLQVLTGEPPEIVAAVVATGTVDELADVVLLAGLRLREALGLGTRLANETRLAGEPGPGHATSARYYYRGLHALRRLDARTALELLERAQQSDPTSPYVQSALAGAWSALGYDARAGDAADAALEAAAGLPREQRLWIEARAHAHHDRWPEATERLRALWLVSASNLEYGHELARAQLDAGRPRDALATLAELRQRSGAAPEDPRIALSAGEASLELGEPRRALEAASESLELARELGASLVTARALSLRARSLHALGRGAEAESDLAQAAGLFSGAGDRASESRVLVALASWLEDRGEAGRAEALERAALATFVDIGDRAGEAMTLQRLAAHVWRSQGAEAAHAMFERAITIYRDIGDRWGEAGALNALAVNNAIHGVQPTVPLFEQALELYRQVGDRARESDMLINLGRSALLGAELATAIERFSAAEAVLRELGVQEGLATTLFNLGYARSLAGQAAAAAASFEQAVEIFRATQNPRMLSASLDGLAEALVQADELVAARRHLEESLQLRRDLEDDLRIATSLTALARVSLLEGDLPGAEETARRAVARAEAAAYPPVLEIARSHLAEVLIECGRPGEARAVIDQLEAKQRPAPDLTRALRRITLARVLGRLGDRPQALEMLDAVVDLAAEKGAQSLRLEAELGRLELGGGTGDDRLSACERLAEQAEHLGLHLLARRARELTVDGRAQPTPPAAF